VGRGDFLRASTNGDGVTAHVNKTAMNTHNGIMGRKTNFDPSAADFIGRP